MDVIDKQLDIANEQTLIELSNKGIYKRALKESKNMTLSAEKIHECYIVKLDGETCTIKSPLDESQCSCVSRGMCRHIITAILLLKAQLPQYDGEDITPEVITSEPEQAEIELPDQPEINSLSQDTQKKIKECAEQCIKIMSGIFTRGLVRAEESDPDNFELAAVSCHALRMAEAERQMRELGSRLKDCVSRRASFSPQVFTHKMFEYADSMNKLIKADNEGPDRSGGQERSGQVDDAQGARRGAAAHLGRRLAQRRVHDRIPAPADEGGRHDDALR